MVRTWVLFTNMDQKQFLSDSLCFFFSLSSIVIEVQIKLKSSTLRFIIALALVQHCEGGEGVCAVNRKKKKKKRKKSVGYITYINNEKQWIRRSYDIPVIL